MADYKCVFNFFSSGKKGGTWSETWFRAATSMAGATTFAEQLLSARLQLCSPMTQLTKIRVSLLNNPRVTAIVQVNRQGQYLFPSTPAPIDSAIVCNVSSTGIPATRRWWWRGWDASMASRSNTTGNDVFPGATVQLVNAWFTGLATFLFEIMPIQKAITPGYQNVPVSQVDGTAGTGQAILTCGNTGGITVGSTVILTKFSKKDLPAINGRYSVLAVTANTLTIPYSTPENQKLLTPGGQVRLLSYISGCTIDPSVSGISFLGGRQTKSPFTGSRGARSANRRLRLSP